MSTTVTRRCRGDVVAVVLATTARTALWIALLLVLWAALPAAVGWHVTTVASDSMAPRLRTGDVVAALPADGDDVRAGQVLLVDDPDREGRLRLHRLVERGPDGLQLKGDANPSADSSRVVPEAVLGVGVVRVPWVGAPGRWVRDGDVAPLLGLGLGAGAAVALTRLDRDVRTGRPCSRCGTPRWQVSDAAVEPACAGAGSPSAPVRAVTAALLTTALVATATGSDAVFTATSSSAASASSGLFPCFAKPLPDSPVLAWDLDEPRGDVVRDLSGHGEDGTLVAGATRRDASCDDDPSASFPGGDSRVQSGRTAAGPTTFTVEAWFRTTSPQGRVLGFSSETTPASGWKDRHLYVGTDGRLRFGVLTATAFKATVAADGRVDDGAWHHAVGRSTPGRMDVWVDGVHGGSRTDIRDVRAYQGSWRAGRESLDAWPGAAVPFSFVGEIDAIRVYDHLLSDEAIVAHHAAGR